MIRALTTGTYLRHWSQEGATPTFIAAQHGHAGCIEALARLGADVNQAKTVRASVWLCVCGCVYVCVCVRVRACACVCAHIRSTGGRG